MKILLLSAYDASSHRRWYQTLQNSFPEYQWTVLSLPARFFSWRIRGNSLSWAFSEREKLEDSYDLLIATSMVDLSSLRGFVPSLACVPTIVYFHENQFAYPISEQQFDSVEPKVVSLYSALAADKVLFNSDYNRETFLAGIEQFLKQMPDYVPVGLVDNIKKKSTVLPVPLDEECYQPSSKDPSAPLEIIWNHRWEYDKGPDRLFAAITRVMDKSCDFRLHVVGQQFRQLPEEFEQLKKRIEAVSPISLGTWGYQESREDYRKLLARVDVVLSTAIHDFQGLSVLEAVAAGALPLVPDRLCYGEWFATEFRYPSYVNDASMEAKGLAGKILDWIEAKRTGQLMKLPEVSQFSIDRLKHNYADYFQQLIS